MKNCLSNSVGVANASVQRRQQIQSQKQMNKTNQLPKEAIKDFTSMSLASLRRIETSRTSSGASLTHYFLKS